ncbi:DUF6492 family protein [Helicobacter sp. MIT 14-3879]|uniref:DUF6492 family protein n=1 Tax=Helicobacter sp. MIT 14-3879 TaxID=2040649 RepID=UPI000E1F42B1|nr:DUF6492 family protein [Helicobacter sp. MIT 14-3879]RDU62096.1 hypothetical protein CQA44_07645 [Helicobacter sp. MIT 14-3879]
MKHFCFFCITHYADYDNFKVMINSFKKHNIQNISFIIALQDNRKYNNESIDDYEFKKILDKFKKFEDKNISIILDSDFASSNLIKNKILKDFSIGYINQEIAKLCFFESNIAEHYLCIDSDSIFIRDFKKEDFFYDDSTPYICLVQDKDLHSKPYYKDFAKARINNIKKIFDFLELKDKRLRTCHNTQIISSIVMKDFKIKVMQNKNLSYSDLLKISPFEFTWYSAYFQKCGIINEVSIEPFFKMYHTKVEYLFDKISNQSLENLKDNYIGVILNSNWWGGVEHKKAFKNRTILDRILFFIIKKSDSFL